MSSKTLISANPSEQRDFEFPEDGGFLEIAEFFCDTIQGEGVNMGCPATFIRFQHCQLACKWCDSESVWREGNPYTFTDLFLIMEQVDLITKFNKGQHLVFTGGSPLKQQINLIRFIEAFIKRYGFKPYIEIENEAVLKVYPPLVEYVDCWNNSPKLHNSGNSLKSRFKEDVLRQLSNFDNSWFKFVISNGTDWEEIKETFLDTNIIKYSQVILMPEATNRGQLNRIREFVVDLAIRENVRYTTREHVIIWDKKTGV